MEEAIGKHLGGGVFERIVSYEPYECMECGEHHKESEVSCHRCPNDGCRGTLGWWEILMNEDPSRLNEFSNLFVMSSDMIISTPFEEIKKAHVAPILEDLRLKVLEERFLYCANCSDDISLGEEVVVVFSEYLNSITSSLELIALLCGEHKDDYLDQEIYYGFNKKKIAEFAEDGPVHHYAFSAEIVESDLKNRFGFGCRIQNLEHLGTHPRKKLYYGPNWQEKRRKVIRRDGEKCVYCGISRQHHRKRYAKDLSVHHIEPFREVAKREEANKIENLEAVCCKCHPLIE